MSPTHINVWGREIMYTDTVSIFLSEPIEKDRQDVVIPSKARKQKRKKRNEGSGGNRKRPRFEGSTLSSPPQKKATPLIQEGHIFTFASLTLFASSGGSQPQPIEITLEASRSAQD